MYTGSALKQNPLVLTQPPSQGISVGAYCRAKIAAFTKIVAYFWDI